ncbi:MAG: acetate--CoA ligase family protein [Dehalobacterium sp.]
MPLDLQKLFNANSIAVIGVSNDLDKIGGQPLKFLLKHHYPGKIYPVNPRYKEVANLVCYPSIKDIKDKVDLAIILVSTSRCLQVIKECVDAKVKFGVICSSGFSEMGIEGKALEMEIKQVANKGGMRLIGPNCQGILNVHKSVIGGFNPALDVPSFPIGNVSVISQSGGIGYGFFSRGIDQNLDFRYLVTTGNECDLTVTDFLEECIKDHQTEIIMLILEGIRDKSKFAEVLEKAKERNIQKPIVVLKVGRTEAGKKAALSHTGALSGSHKIYQALFEKYNLIEVDDIEQGINIIRILKKYKNIGSNIAVVTMSGGTGIIAVDAITNQHLQVASLTEKTKERLKEVIPSYGSANNPIDVTGQIFNDETIFKNTIECLTNSEESDVIVITVGPTAGKVGERLASQIVDTHHKSKPIVVSWSSWKHKGHDILRDAGIPCFYSPLDLAYALGKTAHFTKRKKLSECSVKGTEFATAKNSKEEKLLDILQDGLFTEYESKQLLKKWGVSCTKEGIANTVEEAKKLAASIGFPVALKIVSSDIWHKTEAGLVRLNILDEREAEEATEYLLASARKQYPNAPIKGVLVQEMVNDGVEVIIGIDNSSEFGPLLMFGAGGINVELYKDVVFRMLPVTKDNIYSMIEETKIVKLLKGFRGSEPCDITALVDTIYKIANEFQQFKNDISTIDINPVKVLGNGYGVKVVDAMVGSYNTDSKN